MRSRGRRWSRYVGFERYGWYSPRPPKQPPPRHGIKVKKVGITWWGQRWLAALEKISWEYSNRLARGRTYARAGRVHDLKVIGGKVSARVTGSNPTPYMVRLEMARLSDRAWARAIEAMAEKAIFAAQLLSGEMPKEIDEAFRPARASLFPNKAGDLETECSCPDWANPCKHIAATHFVLGDAFDKDPFLLFELRGRSRDQVLEALRRSRAGSVAEALEDEAAAPPIPTVALDRAAVEGYEHPRGSWSELQFRIEPPAAPAVILRQLGSPGSWSLDTTIVELLGPAYEAAGAFARKMALGSDE